MTFDEWTEDDHSPCQFCGEDDCMCPPEPLYCAHRVDVTDYCPDCAVAGERELQTAVQRRLDEIRREADEEVGAGLAARFEGRG